MATISPATIVAVTEVSPADPAASRVAYERHTALGCAGHGKGAARLHNRVLVHLCTPTDSQHPAWVGAEVNKAVERAVLELRHASRVAAASR
jgi:hypothetical protein